MTDISVLLATPMIAKIVVTALVVGVLVSICASLLGVTLVLKKYSMIGDGLSHVGYGALAISAALGIAGQDSLKLSLPIVIIAAFFLLKLSEKSRLNSDAAIALVSTSAMAIGTVIFTLKGGTAADACSSLFGSASLLTVSTDDLILSGIMAVLTITLFTVFYTRIFAVTFDEDFAKATGTKTGLYNCLIAVLTAVTIVVGMSLMGAVLVSGIIIFPTVTANRFCRSFRGVTVAAALLSVACFLLGFFAAIIFGLQIGPAVIIANLAAYVISTAVSIFLKR